MLTELTDFTDIRPFAANGSFKEDAVNSSDMVETISNSLNQPKGHNSIASYLII